MAGSCEASGVALFIGQNTHQLQSLATDLSNEMNCSFALMEDNVATARQSSKVKSSIDGVVDASTRTSTLNHGIDNASTSSHVLVEDFVLHPKEQNMPSFWIPPLDSVQVCTSDNGAQNMKFDPEKTVVYTEASNIADLVQAGVKTNHLCRLPPAHGHDGQENFNSMSTSTNSQSGILMEKHQKRGKQTNVSNSEQPVVSGADEFKGGGEFSLNEIQKLQSKNNKISQSSAHQLSSLGTACSSAVAAEFGGQYRMSLARKAMSVWMKRHNQRTDSGFRQSTGHQSFGDQAALQAQAAQNGNYIFASFGEENYYPMKSVMSANMQSALEGVLDLPMNFQSQDLTFQTTDPATAKSFIRHGEMTGNHVSSTNAAVTKKKKWKRPLAGGLKTNKPPPFSMPTMTHTSSAPPPNVTEWGGVMKWLGWYREKVEEYKQAGEDMPLCKRVYRDKIGLETMNAPENQKKKKSKKKRSDRRQEHSMRSDLMQQDMNVNSMHMSALSNNNAMTLSTLCNGADGKPVVAARATVNGNSYVTAQVNTKLAGGYTGISNLSRTVPSSSVQQQLGKVHGVGSADVLPSSVANNVPLMRVATGMKDRAYGKMQIVDSGVSYGNHNDPQMFYSLGNFPVGGVSSADVREAANADNLVPTVPSDLSKGYGNGDLGLLASIQAAGAMDASDQVITPTSHKTCPLDTMDLSWDGCLPSPPVQLNHFSADLFHGRSTELPSDIVSSYVSFDSPFHLLLEAASLPRVSQQVTTSSLPSFTRTFAASNHAQEGSSCHVSLLDVQAGDDGQFYDKLLTNSSMRLLRSGIDTPAPIVSYVAGTCITEEESKRWYDLPPPVQSLSCEQDIDNELDSTRLVITNPIDNADENSQRIIDGVGFFNMPATAAELDQWPEPQHCVDHNNTVEETAAGESNELITSIEGDTTPIKTDAGDCVVRQYTSNTTNTVTFSWIESRVLVTGPYSRWK